MRSERPSRKMTDDQKRAAEQFISGAEVRGDEDSRDESPDATGGNSSTDESTGESRTGSEGKRGGPHSPTQEGTEDDPLPWNAPRVRSDVKQNYPLRLPEPLYLKLKYLSQETGQSMNALCNEAVETLVSERLQDLLRSGA